MELRDISVDMIDEANRVLSEIINLHIDGFISYCKTSGFDDNKNHIVYKASMLKEKLENKRKMKEVSEEILKLKVENTLLKTLYRTSNNEKIR